jgi:diacylglycerol kinase (ATP)
MKGVRRGTGWDQGPGDDVICHSPTHAQRAGAVDTAGLGLDAALVRSVNPRLKHMTGQAAFWLAYVQQLVRWQPRPFTVEVDGQRHDAIFTVVANAASYGGGLRLAPRASLESDCLDLCLFAWTTRLPYLRHLRSGMDGAHLGLPGVTYVQAREALASGSGVWVQVDGELLDELPMTFACVPAALSLVVP